MTELEPELVIDTTEGGWRAIASSLAAGKATGEPIEQSLLEAVDRVRMLAGDGKTRMTVSLSDARVMLMAVRTSLGALKVLLEVRDDPVLFRERFAEVAGVPVSEVPEGIEAEVSRMVDASYSDLCAAISDLRLSAGCLAEKGLVMPALDPEAIRSVLRASLDGFKPCDPECERCERVRQLMVELLAMIDGSGSGGVVTVSIPMMRTLRDACDRYADIVMDLPAMDRISERRLADLAESLDEFLWRAEGLDDDE